MKSKRSFLDRISTLLVAALAGFAPACGSSVPGNTGNPDPAPSSPPAPPPGLSALPARVPTPQAPAPPSKAITVTRLRRLGNVEIENVVTDLAGERLGVTSGFLDDPRVQGYDNDATALGMSESKLEELGLVAERVAAFVTTPDRIAGQAPCAAGEVAGACAERFVTRFARKAWGRPPTADELARLGPVFTAGMTGGDYASGIALVAEAMLLSPHFVYHTELGEPAVTGAGARPEVTLAGAEIASEISFLARGARPDEELLQAGLGGQLLDPAARSAQATRLLATPEGRQQMARFVRAWLGLDDVAVINKDLGVYPLFTPAVRAALDRELSLFLDHVFSSVDGRLDELFLADYSFPGLELKEIYGTDLISPLGNFTRAGLDPKRRRGLLGSPAFLARHALISQTNPIERGLVIRSRLFCQDMPGPPPSVAAVTPTGGPETTTRSKYEAHLKEEFCHGCHRLMDPLGFGLEQFDPIGRFRTHEGVNLVDASGTVADTDVDGTFVGPAMLAERLVRSAQFRRCLVAQLYQFAGGRTLDHDLGDDAEVDHLAWLFEQADDSIPKLVAALVARPGFVLRRLGEPTVQP